MASKNIWPEIQRRNNARHRRAANHRFDDNVEKKHHPVGKTRRPGAGSRSAVAARFRWANRRQCKRDVVIADARVASIERSMRANKAPTRRRGGSNVRCQHGIKYHKWRRVRRAWRNEVIGKPHDLRRQPGSMATLKNGAVESWRPGTSMKWYGAGAADVALKASW